LLYKTTAVFMKLLYHINLCRYNNKNKRLFKARDNISLVTSVGDKATVCGFRTITQNIAMGYQRAAVCICVNHECAFPRMHLHSASDNRTT